MQKRAHEQNIHIFTTQFTVEFVTRGRFVEVVMGWIANGAKIVRGHHGPWIPPADLWWIYQVKHKSGPVPSHKASQNFSIRPFDSKLIFWKSICLHMKHKNGPIPSHRASQNFSTRPFDSKLNFRKPI